MGPYPWLHVSQGVDGVLCFHCSKYFKVGKPTQAKSVEAAFFSVCFKNWEKKALEWFSMHEKSEGHKVAITATLYGNRSISAQLSNAHIVQQNENRGNLLKIISGVMFLLRQGLALEGHDHQKWNLDELLKYKAENDPSLTRCLSTPLVYTSWECQNEFIDQLSFIN